LQALVSSLLWPFLVQKSVVSFPVVARAHILQIFGSQNEVLSQTPQLLKRYPQAAMKLFDDGVNRKEQKKKFSKKRMRNARATGIHAAAPATGIHAAAAPGGFKILPPQALAACRLYDKTPPTELHRASARKPCLHHTILRQQINLTTALQPTAPRMRTATLKSVSNTCKS
jgi:hypothetical protein